MQSQIDQVVVYRKGAVVTRRLDLEQPAQGWPARLRLEGLPISMVDSSLQARLEFPQGGGGVVARELKVELVPSGPLPTAADEELAALGQEAAGLQIRLQALHECIEGMKRLHPGAPLRGEGPTSFPLQSRRAVVELRQRKLSAWLPRFEELQARLQELEERQRQLRAPQAPPELRKAVLVTLRTAPAGPTPALRLWLSYLVEGAAWAPGYSLRLDRDYTMGRLELRAMVGQCSGEDWTDVELRVSTADPAAWTELPRLTSRRLGRQQTAPLPGWRPLPPNSEQLLADYDGVPAAPVSPLPSRLGDLPCLAILLMSLPPELSARLFQEMGPDAVQALTLEITRLPSLRPEDRQAAAQALCGCDLEQVEHLVREHPAEIARNLAVQVGLPVPPRDVSRSRQALAPAKVAARFALDAMPGKQMAIDADLHSGSLDADAHPAVPARNRAAQSGLPLPTGSKPVGQLESLCSAGPVVCDLLTPLGSAQTAVGSAVRSSEAREAPRQRPAGIRSELDERQLHFEALYLSGPEEPTRGKLRLRTPLEACVAQWPDRAFAREAARSLTETLASATVRNLPPGYRAPQPIEQQDWLYPGEARLDLASDGQFHSLPLFTRELAARLHWKVVPKVTPDVFRRVELECPADLALPPGPVDLFVGSDYLACVELPGAAAGQLCGLELGVESAIRVLRKAAFREQSAGVMGGTLQLHHEVTIEAANHLSRPVRLEVLEALPHPVEGSDCKVRLESSWERLPDEQPGCRHWLGMAPGERATCSFAYVIEIPSRLELVGGNRREA